MKRLLIATLLLIVLTAAVGGLVARRALSPAAPEGTPVWFHVTSGETLRDVARELKSRGVIRSADAFVWFGRLAGVSHRIQAGRYLLSPADSAPALLGRFVRGETAPYRVTVREGIWLTELAALLADSLPVDSAAVIAAAGDGRLLDRYGIEAENGEGYLFPATYEFSGREDAHEALAKLMESARDIRDDGRRGAADSLGLGWHDVLTLASIIEAETARDDERNKVSAVYHRRLRRGMKLQADPTIVYAFGARGRSLTYADLELDSPYNTYRHRGLPPGPIGNPGLAAIDAALHPDSACTALYFFATDGGTHVFSETFQEHTAGLRKRR